MQKLLLPITIMAALVIGATSCSSLNARSSGSHSGLYPGIKAIKDNNATDPVYQIVDGPLSLALDTALLPLDILGSVFKGKDNNASVPELPK